LQKKDKGDTEKENSWQQTNKRNCGKKDPTAGYFTNKLDQFNELELAFLLTVVAFIITLRQRAPPPYTPLQPERPETPILPVRIHVHSEETQESSSESEVSSGPSSYYPPSTTTETSPPSSSEDETAVETDYESDGERYIPDYIREELEAWPVAPPAFFNQEEEDNWNEDQGIRDEEVGQYLHQLYRSEDYLDPEYNEVEDFD
jgi:hypothetical protein